MNSNHKIKKQDFKSSLSKYLSIRGLDVIVLLNNGKKIELEKERKIVSNEIVFFDKNRNELRIPINTIKSVDFFAA